MAVKDFFSNGNMRVLMIIAAIGGGSMAYLDARFGGHRYTRADADRDRAAIREYQTLVNGLQDRRIDQVEKRIDALCYSKTHPQVIDK